MSLYLDPQQVIDLVPLDLVPLDLDPLDLVPLDLVPLDLVPLDLVPLDLVIDLGFGLLILSCIIQQSEQSCRLMTWEYICISMSSFQFV